MSVYYRRSGLWVALAGTTAPPPAQQPPTQPGPITVSNVTSTSLTVAWGASSDPDGTVVGYRISVNGGQPTVVTALSANLTGLTADTALTITVAAVDNAGNVGPVRSVDTRTAIATGTGPPPTVSHGFYITAGNTGYRAYYDSGLGRTLIDSDLQVYTTKVNLSSLTSAGGTITKKWFRAGIFADIDNVTLRGCRSDVLLTGRVTSSLHRPINFDYCSVIGTGQPEAINFNNWTANRCYLHAGSDGVKANGNVTLTESYVRCIRANSTDHNDAVQNVGGAGPVTVARCNLDARPTNAAGVAGSGVFQLGDGGTGLQTIEDNYLQGGGYSLRMYENYTFKVDGNWFLNGSWTYGPVATNRSSSQISWGTERPNLIVDANGSRISTLPAP